MKIEVDLYGVEQATDFDTLETSAFVVLGIFGESVRVPITEDQMVRLTSEAVRAKQGAGVGADPDTELPFVDTRVPMTGPPSAGAPKGPERPFSVMQELGDRNPGVDEDAQQSELGEVDPGVGGLFEENQEEKEAKLRAQAKQNARGPAAAPRTVPRDEAGNPVVAQNPAANLPPIGNPTSDDDFPQG